MPAADSSRRKICTPAAGMAGGDLGRRRKKGPARDRRA
ncbi:MAG: hypothetical protein JWO72_2970, partial [Caulobacteraceae bacterium]|nr:hypothetical protein [Caulobacteraceae bacterium]